MNKVNYQKELEKTLAGLGEKTPHLLLHACCAPCSSYVLEYLSEYYEITVLYYNPNISPESEYVTRANEEKRLIEEQPHKNPVHFILGDYNPQKFYAAVKGLENEPECGARCRICYEMRLRKAAEIAKEIGADCFTTSLTVGPLKDGQVMNEMGIKIEAETGIPYLRSDFKKKNGYLRSIELSKMYGLYRQNYCGCIFSKLAREREESEKASDLLG